MGALGGSKCGKRLVHDWVHTAPDGTQTFHDEITTVMNLMATQGGQIAKRSRRI